MRVINSSFLNKALILALMAAAPLAAQDGKFRFGGQLSFASPIGDLSNVASAGFGAALLGEMALDENFAIRGRLDYNSFGEKDILVFKSSMSAFGVAADAVYYINGGSTGLFVLATAGIANWTWKLKMDAPGVNFSESDNTVGLSYGVGAGYNFNKNFGAEAKYMNGPSLSSDSLDDKGTNYFTVSLTYRF